MTAITRKTITAEIKKYFEDHPEIFAECIEDLDDYNGYLHEDRRFDMDELDFHCEHLSPSEILMAALYGRDDGCKDNYATFNLNRNYFYFTVYGNLVSTDYKDYSDYLDDYTISQMCDSIDYIDSIKDDNVLAALFEELQQAQTEDD